jgi:pyridoxine 5'-phosphate synthase PdxJ
MARLTVVLNEIYNISGVRESRTSGFRAQVASLCELAGADGVAYQIIGDSISPADDKIVKILKEIVNTPVALIFPAIDRVIDRAIDLKPDMAVIMNAGVGAQDIITKIQVSDIIAAIMVAPEMDLVKEAAKMKADYVVLDISAYCSAPSYSTKLALFDNIAKAAALAKRLSMGAIIHGALTVGEIPKFAELEGVEEFFIGNEMAARAILNGLEKTIGTFKKASESGS